MDFATNDLHIDFIAVKESDPQLEFTNNASGILGLAPNQNSILKEASFIYDL